MEFKEIINKHRSEFGKVIGIDYHHVKCLELDLSRTNPELSHIDFSKAETFTKYVNKKLEENHAVIGIGKYNENRIIYDHSDVFAGGTRRTIHLGIDLFVKAGIDILCPFEGKIHSFQDNAGQGDYGPTIILEHEIDEIKFYTLYGHLSRYSLQGLSVGKRFKKGDIIAIVGDSDVNGGWPPHLHFQIITDMLGKSGDYPGVISISDREKFLRLCPDPNIILNIEPA